MKTDDIDLLARELARFFQQYRILPPGIQNLFETLAKNPVQYLAFCHALAEKHPDVMKAIIGGEHGDIDHACDGEQCGEEFRKDFG